MDLYFVVDFLEDGNGTMVLSEVMLIPCWGKMSTHRVGGFSGSRKMREIGLDTNKVPWSFGFSWFEDGNDSSKFMKLLCYWIKMIVERDGSNVFPT